MELFHGGIFPLGRRSTLRRSGGSYHGIGRNGR
jgi:hypothetical protein